MTVLVFGSPVRHRADRLDADQRLVWTRCGIRLLWDPHGYERALRQTGASRPAGRCAGCAA